MGEQKTFAPDSAKKQKPHLTHFGGKNYDVRKLEAVAESLPTEQFDLSNTAALEPILKGKYWKDADGNSIGPSDLLDAFAVCGQDWEKVEKAHPEWAHHIAKTRRVNYETPVLVHNNTLIDGIHRLTKALSEGATTLPMKVFEQLPTDAEYNE